MGTRPILQVLKMFPVFFPGPVQVQCERFLLKPYNPFFLVPVPVPVPDQASVNTPLLWPKSRSNEFWKLPPAICEGYVFTPVCDSVNRGDVRGGGQGACMVEGCAWWRGHTWWRGCMAKGGCVVKGGMHGKGGDTWQRGLGWGACMVKGGHAWWRGACMVRGVCVAKGGCAWQRGGVVKEGDMCGEGGCVVCTPPLYEIRPVNARAVRILLECILVCKFFLLNIYVKLRILQGKGISIFYIDISNIDWFLCLVYFWVFRYRVKVRSVRWCGKRKTFTCYDSKDYYLEKGTFAMPYLQNF